jgi:hypothetical protein
MYALRDALRASVLLLVVATTQAAPQTAAGHRVVPLTKIASDQWIEVLSGDPAVKGAPYVIRIHNDANYIVLPHNHPEDENIVVVQGSWSLGMGARVNRQALDPMELGTFGLVPKRMAHFAWSKTETIIQVHGIGPFSTDFIDPLYDLTDKGAVLFSLPLVTSPANAPQTGPDSCFSLKLGMRVRGNAGLGEGVIVGGQCSPALQFTQYWVQKANGERFWAPRDELTTL